MSAVVFAGVHRNTVRSSGSGQDRSPLRVRSRAWRACQSEGSRHTVETRRLSYPHAGLNLLEKAVELVEQRGWCDLAELMRTRLPDDSPSRPLSRPPKPMTADVRVPSPMAAQGLRLMARDGFSCWCGRALLPSPTLWALHEATPIGAVPYDYNGKRDRNPAALDHRWAEFDHIRSPKRRADPGSPDNDRNLVTSCASCNRRKGHFTFTELGLNPNTGGPMSSALWRVWVDLHRTLRRHRIDRLHGGDGCCWKGPAVGFNHAAFDAAIRREPVFADAAALAEGWP